MAKQITIEGGIYLNTEFGVNRWETEQFRFLAGSLVESFDRHVLVQPHTLTFELADNYDPRPVQIEALEEQRAEITAKFQAAVTEINARISKLQAIGYEPVEVAEVADDDLPL